MMTKYPVIGKLHPGIVRMLACVELQAGRTAQDLLQQEIGYRHFEQRDDRPAPAIRKPIEFGDPELDQLAADLGTLMFKQPFDEAPDFTIVDSARRADVRSAYRYLEKMLILTDLHTDQAGIGALVCTLRRQALQQPADPETGLMPRMIGFSMGGIGYCSSELIATFPAAGAKAHLGEVEISLQGQAEPFVRIPVAAITGYRANQHSIEALGPLHRHGRYGEGMSTFGDWFTADGHGRELLAAKIAGLVNRVLPDVRNNLGGVSPQFALTTAGIEYVLRNPKLPMLFDHYSQIDKVTAFVADGDRRVPFDTRTGAVLGWLDVGAAYAPAYITKTNLAGVEAGKEYSRDELGYLLSLNFDESRRQQVGLEDQLAVTPALVQLSEEEFDEEYGLVAKPEPDCSTMFEWEEVQDLDPKRVWTVIEGDQDDTLFAVPGVHHVNRVGFAVTEKPWPHEHIEAVYLGSMEHEHNFRP